MPVLPGAPKVLLSPPEDIGCRVLPDLLFATSPRGFYLAGSLFLRLSFNSAAFSPNDLPSSLPLGIL